MKSLVSQSYCKIYTYILGIGTMMTQQKHSEVLHKQLKEIDFTGAASLKRKFDCSVVTDKETSPQQQPNTREVVCPPSEEQFQTFKTLPRTTEHQTSNYFSSVRLFRQLCYRCSAV